MPIIVAETPPVKFISDSKNEKPIDKIEISNTAKAFAKLDNFLNLGKKDRLDTSDLNEEEKKEFLKMLAKLLQEGIVGYEILEINGKPEKHYIVNQIGDERIKGAKLYKKYLSDGTN
ncbi:MAG: hypothetical protein KF816_01345 [Melioribacteraceae bacterium]|nr:hypothetical protein [Melioribacteraceae bacterium]